MYLTFDEYTSYGGTVDELTFDRINFRVEKLIDNLTFRRVKDESPVRECVKRLAFELFDLEQLRTASNVSPAVSSMSNDGVSVSYADGETASGTFNAHAKALAVTYLADEVDDNGVCLLYAGRFE